jgi:hypothetical protein
MWVHDWIGGVRVRAVPKEVVMRRAAIIILAMLGVSVASCGGSAAEEASDPWGFDGVTAPATQEEVNIVFLAMPGEIDGMAAYRDDPEHVGGVMYTGEDSHAGVVWQQVGVDRATTIEQMEVVANADQFAELGSNIDSDSTAIWLYGTLVEQDDQQLLYWGDPSDGWLFVFEADTVEHLDAVAAEFISAASSD